VAENEQQFGYTTSAMQIAEAIVINAKTAILS